MAQQSSDTDSSVLVTGGSGYIASWIIKVFLDAGFTVRTTVRNKSNTEKIAHLLQLESQYPGKLTFYEADLLVDGSFAEATDGVSVVIHTASPFFTTGIRDAQKQLIEPALSGTRNVFNQALVSPTVSRIVLTSSIVAMYGDAVDLQRKQDSQQFDEGDWNFSSTLKHQPYSLSKTLAEREAWKMIEEQNRVRMVVINPGFVLGPSLSKRKDSTSIDFMLSMLRGKFRFGVPDLLFGMVDVRDIARAHFLAATKEEANGRYCMVSDTLSIVDMSRILREKYGNRFKLPQKKVPKLMAYLVGPLFGLKMKFVKKNVGLPLAFDNAKAKNEVGIDFIPPAKTLTDHAEQLLRDSLV